VFQPIVLWRGCSFTNSSIRSIIHHRLGRIGPCRIVSLQVRDHIDCQSDGYPIAECDNSSRVIKYVAILGYCYSSCDLVETRVHDIRVVADLNRHDPMAANLGERIVSDATSGGYQPSTSAVEFVTTLVNALMTESSMWWTGWWPVLHVRCSRSTGSGGVCTLQIGIDILAVTTLEEFGCVTPVDDRMSDTQFTTLMESNWKEFYNNAFPTETVLYAAAEGIAIAMDVLLFFMSKVPTADQLIAYSSLLVLWTGLMLAFLCAVWDGVITGRTSYGSAYGLLVITGLITLGEDLVPLLSVAQLFKQIWYMRGLTGVGFRVRWCAALAIFNAFIRIVFGFTMMFMALLVYELQVTSMNSI